MDLRRAVRRLAGWTLASALATACANTLPPPPVIDGRMASGGGALGDWDLYPTRCTRKAGEAILDREGDSRRKLRLVERPGKGSPTLAKIEVHMLDDAPTGTTDILLTDATCVTGTFDTDGKTRAGDIRVDCTTGEGGHVVGALRFANCL